MLHEYSRRPPLICSHYKLLNICVVFLRDCSWREWHQITAFHHSVSQILTGAFNRCGVHALLCVLHHIIAEEKTRDDSTCYIAKTLHVWFYWSCGCTRCFINDKISSECYISKKLRTPQQTRITWICMQVVSLKINVYIFVSRAIIYKKNSSELPDGDSVLKCYIIRIKNVVETGVLGSFSWWENVYINTFSFLLKHRLDLYVVIKQTQAPVLQ